MVKKQSSAQLSSLASKVLGENYQPTKAEIRQLAASVLSQDETKGSVVKKKRKLQTAH